MMEEDSCNLVLGGLKFHNNLEQGCYNSCLPQVHYSYHHIQHLLSPLPSHTLEGWCFQASLLLLHNHYNH